MPSIPEPACPDDEPLRIGVVAMQGAFAAHVRALGDCGCDAIEVRSPAQLDGIDGIVIPGGESTAIRKAMQRCGLLKPLRKQLAGGLPGFGTCAGMIILADAPDDGAPPCFGLLDVDVVRNGFGRQVHSAEWEIAFEDARATGSFIRAPRITRVGAGVRVIASLAREPDVPVVVQQGNLLAASWHPELGSDRRLHRQFVELVRQHRTLRE